MQPDALAGPLDPGDHVAELLDGLHLLLQVLALDEVAQLGVAGAVGRLVEVEEGLKGEQKNVEFRGFFELPM